MFRAVRKDNDAIAEKIRKGQIDAAHLSTRNPVEDILLSMHHHNVLACLEKSFPDKRAPNTVIPFKAIMASSIAAKMKVKSSMTDIPGALTDQRLLNEMGFTFVDEEGVGKSLMCEGTLRNLIKKYDEQEFIDIYNKTVQDHIMPEIEAEANIHILDCTKIEVNNENWNYEKAGRYIEKKKVGNDIIKIPHAGYKASILRGIVQDAGLIEEICLGPITTHDFQLSKDIIYNSPVLKREDSLLVDRGYIDRKSMNYLKNVRGVDTYIPLKKGMETFDLAIAIAKKENKWYSHPNKKRVDQQVAFVSDLGSEWVSDNPKDDVPLNAAVVYDMRFNKYRVFVTTDTTKTAPQILKMYDLRWEIEEEFRQLKDFWVLDDFTSTKINTIAFHMICVLFGYLFFQIYTMLPEGEQYLGKSLPVIQKNYRSEIESIIVLYSGQIFGIMTILALFDIAENGDAEVKASVREILKLI